MLNVALFISGRLVGFKDCLLPFINNNNKKYNIFLFFSINTFSLDKNDNDLDFIISDLKNTFGTTIGDIYFEEYKFQVITLDLLLRLNLTEIAEDYSITVRGNKGYSFIYLEKFRMGVYCGSNLDVGHDCYW